MDRLLEGYRRFRAEIWPNERARYEALSKRGQNPEALVISCSDSRVDPQTVFGAVPGELFVVRNVAGLVPPYQPDSRYHGTSAALEYAVRVLKVSRIVVLTHAQCGGVTAMVQGMPKEAGDFVAPWMEIAAPVLRSIPQQLRGAEIMEHCELGVAQLALTNLATYPWIQEAIDAGNLVMRGYRFDIHTGELMQPEGDRFVPVAR